MAYNSNIQVEMTGNQAGQTVYTKLEYHKVTPTDNASALTVATYWKGAIWDAIKPLVTPQFTMLQIYVRCYNVGGVPQINEYTLDVNETGTAADQPLPPNVTVSMIKYVDNLTKDPVTANDFRNGRVSFSGIPEDAQNNGLLTPVAVAAWQAIADALMELEFNFDGALEQWQLGLERNIPNNEKVLVQGVQVRSKVGTQNTRKR